MATVVSKKLSIDKNNIEQYCDAQNVSFNVSDHAWRKWLNGSKNGYVILKPAGKNELYPTDTAHPFKADSLISASRSAGKCSVALQFAGTAVHSESFTTTTQREKSKTNIVNNAISNSTNATEIKWHVEGANGDNQRGDKIELTLYFNQYTMVPHIGTGVQGIKSVNVSTSTPYQGDTVTFSAELVKGVVWNGWYSDAACTNLVSGNRNYSFTASSDVTLYAKATAPAAIYNCSAVAKEGVSLAVVSDDQVVSGETCTFAATMQDYYTFTGWYMDEDCTVLVSNDNPYTTPIVSNATFYAKGELVKHNVSVAQPQDGSASVSANQVSHGDSATFTCIVNNNNNREFYGWYKDAAHTQLVSSETTYVATITSDTTLYPFIGKIRHTKIIHPVKLFDALPYRGLVNGANPSQSIPVDVSKITNIGLDQATSAVFAYQPHSTAANFTHGMSIWFGANPISEMPDNATIIGIQAKFGYSLGDGDYSSVKIGFGRFEYISDNDETPITSSGSYAYTGEDDEALPEDEVLLQAYLNASYLVNRASNFDSPMLSADTTQDLTIQPGTGIIQATITVPTNNPEEYPTSVANLKAGKLGFQINCKNGSTSATNRMLRLHAFDLYITYTIEDVSYKCDAISDGYTDVIIQSRDVAPGVENTWIARSIGGYRFDGWYSDPERTNLVSAEQEYVATVTAPLTLYAKSRYHSRVVTRVLDIPMGKGHTYFIGMDTNNNVLPSETSGSGWKADFNASDYGWLADIGGISDVVAAACMTNKSSTPYTIKAVLNTAAKNVLFPNNTAHMVRLDSNAELGRAAISTRLISGRFKDPMNGNDYITPCFDGICGQVWRPNMIHNVQMVNTNIRHNWVLNVTKQSEIGYLMHQSSSSAYRAQGVNNITLTGYFEEYDYAANIATNSRGIRSAVVNQAIGYEGDTIVFTANVGSYATFDGWYNDKAGTQLVSTEPNYSSVPDANMTLYAKASAPDGEIYTCQAVAKDNVATASVSEPDMLAGGSVTFTATINPGIRFLGWYSDESCTQLVSNQLSYTATITADTTLYAKAHKITLNMSVGSAEHGVASVSATTVPYGNDVTFTFMPEDETWELYGWYSDSALTQLVSEANPYTFTATEDTTLYPKIGKKRYTIKYGRARDAVNGGRFKINIIVVDFNSLTRDEINCLRTGDYDSIDSSKIVARDSISDSNIAADSWKTIQCTCDMHVAVYLPEIVGTDNYYALVRDGDENNLTYWPYYWFQPTTNATISSYNYRVTHWCNCSVVTKDGITYAYATTPTLQEKEAIFEAELSPGYKFLGWYSDEACAKLVSTANPANVVTPKYTTNTASQTSLTLYAKATKATYTIGVGTAKHCTPSVSATTAQYGDTVTFNCVVDEGYEFKGWYSDSGLTQLVSENAEYVHSVAEDITLWAKVELIVYNLILHPTGYDAINFSSNTEIRNVECLYENDSHSPTNSYATWYINGNTSTNPASLAFYVAGEKFINIPDNAQITDINVLIRMGDTIKQLVNKSAKLHEIYTAQRNIENSEASYNQVGIKKYTDKSEIPETEIIPYTLTNTEVGSWTLATFKAGKFGIVLSASFDPSAQQKQEITHIYNIDISISYNLSQNAPATSLLFKTNGTWKNALAVFKKANGTWVQQSNPASLFSGSPSGTESNYLYLGE